MKELEATDLPGARQAARMQLRLLSWSLSTTYSLNRSIYLYIYRYIDASLNIYIYIYICIQKPVSSMMEGPKFNSADKIDVFFHACLRTCTWTMHRSTVLAFIV
jgi:hypothetical protein